MKKLIISLTLSVFTTSGLYAQTDQDAFRYSRPSLSGTARYTSMGGAFGALGGDFSTLGSNPAGIAIYRRSELTFTPSIYVGNTSSSFLGNAVDENRFNFNIGNAGLVYTNKLTNDETSPGWKSWNFGFGYNRMNNFHNNFSYEGFNKENSLTDFWAQNSNGLPYADLDPFYEYLAYYTYLINPDSLNNYSAAAANGNILQRRNAETRGSIGEVDFSFGGNYSNRLYLGGTMGLSTIRYVEDITYEEIDTDNLIDTLNQYEFRQYLNTKGSGINFKFGMIYRATDWLRVGAAIHSPTWYSMQDNYDSEIGAQFDNGYRTKKESPDGFFDYELTTPFKAIGSLAFIYEKYGLFSIDYEYTDISQARLGAAEHSFSSTNSVIRKKYTGSGTIRLGTEWRAGNLSFRGGAVFSGSPLTASYAADTYDFSSKSFSGGFGIRDNNLFVDFGYVHTISKEYFQPYTLSTENVAGVNNKVSSGNFTITLGARF